MAKKKPAFPSRPCPKCGTPIHIKTKKHEACGWRAANSAGSATPAEPGAPEAAVGAETVAGYFRCIFDESPRLLGERSNDKLLTRWLADHPGHTEVPAKVKSNLSNIKSVLRSRKRKKAARRAEAAPLNSAAPPAPPVTKAATASRPLEALEVQIDECLILARQMDREGLQDVIGSLRRARNAVVWKLGQ
jgi:hypothetical protein